MSPRHLWLNRFKPHLQDQLCSNGIKTIHQSTGTLKWPSWKGSHWALPASSHFPLNPPPYTWPWSVCPFSFLPASLPGWWAEGSSPPVHTQRRGVCSIQKWVCTVREECGEFFSWTTTGLTPGIRGLCFGAVWHVHPPWDVISVHQCHRQMQSR